MIAAWNNVGESNTQKFRDKIIGTVWFYLCKVQKQTKPIRGDRSQDSNYFWGVVSGKGAWERFIGC